MRSSLFPSRLTLATCVTLFACAPAVQAQTVKLAVAANFVDGLNALITAYKTAGRPYSSVATFGVTSGATGVLSSSITTALAAGAQTPYDLFFSADDTTPDSLRAAYPNRVQVPYFYAQGYLVLWSKYGPNVSASGYSGFPASALSYMASNQVAIADPVNAPYGTAAQQVLKRVHNLSYPGGAYDAKFKSYATITATYNAINASTGPTSYPNMGFVAKSLVCDPTTAAVKTSLIGTYWQYTPAAIDGNAPHDRILQSAVAVRGRTGANAAHVDDFSSFVKSTSGKTIIQKYCYSTTTN